MTDEQLVEKFLAGDEKALEALIERYLKSIYNFIFQLVREKNAAEDVAQEVFVKMWENLSGFNQEKKFNSWLYAIARNTAFDWLRKKKALPFAAFENTEGYNLLEEIIDEKGFDYRQFIIEMDMRLEMEGILSKLPITAQSILLLHHKHGFSLVENVFIWMMMIRHKLRI